MKCAVELCGRAHIARGLCTKHYQEVRRTDAAMAQWPKRSTPETCTVEGCSGLHEAKGLCTKHYQRFNIHGSAAGRDKPENKGSIRSDGYIDMNRPGKPRTKAHIIVAERVLGKSLPVGAVVHHVDEDRANNEPSNLVICPNRAYHNLIHQRMRAMDACGNPNWRKCQFCGAYDAVENLHYVNGRKGSIYHLKCRNAHRRAEQHRSSTV